MSAGFTCHQVSRSRNAVSVVKGAYEEPETRENRPFFTGKTAVAGPVVQYFQGVGYFVKGIVFLRSNTSFIKYLLLPFFLSASLYTLMLFVFFVYSSTIVSYMLPEYDQTLFLKVIWYLLFFTLNVFVLVVMLVTAVLVTNIIASPFYDYVSLKIEELKGKESGYCLPQVSQSQFFGEPGRVIHLIMEEIKKSIFVAILPVLTALIPVVGPVLATLLLTVFIAWEYIDYALSRRKSTLKGRLSVIYGNKMYFLGFGTPLIIPVLNFFLFPVAIVGATLLYLDCLREEEGQVSPSASKS